MSGGAVGSLQPPFTPPPRLQTPAVASPSTSAAPPHTHNTRPPGRYYTSSDGSLAATTLGNFGRVSRAHNRDGAAATLVADALFMRERSVRASPRGVKGAGATAGPQEAACAARVGGERGRPSNGTGPSLNPPPPKSGRRHRSRSRSCRTRQRRPRPGPSTSAPRSWRCRSWTPSAVRPSWPPASRSSSPPGAAAARCGSWQGRGGRGQPGARV
jgi:hypothetical protein